MTFQKRGRHGRLFAFERKAEEKEFLAIVVVELDAGKSVGFVVEEDDQAILDFEFFKHAWDLLCVLGIQEMIEAHPGGGRLEILEPQIVFVPREDVDEFLGNEEPVHVRDQKFGETKAGGGTRAGRDIDKSEVNPARARSERSRGESDEEEEKEGLKHGRRLEDQRTHPQGTK